MSRQLRKTVRKPGESGKVARWVLRLNSKGQTTIPIEVRRALGIDEKCRELELVMEREGYHLLPHKPPLPIKKYLGYCAKELEEIDDPVVFVRQLRSGGAVESEE